MEYRGRKRLLFHWNPTIVSLLQTDPQIVAHSAIARPNNEQRMRVFSILYHQYTAPSSRKWNSSLSLPLYSVIFLFSVCQPYPLTSVCHMHYLTSFLNINPISFLFLPFPVDDPQINVEMLKKIVEVHSTANANLQYPQISLHLATHYYMS